MKSSEARAEAILVHLDNYLTHFGRWKEGKVTLHELRQTRSGLKMALAIALNEASSSARSATPPAEDGS